MDFPELVELFARNPVALISEDSEYSELCRLNAGNPKFSRQRDAVEIAKQSIEVLLTDQPSNQREVYQALMTLQAQRSADFEIYLGLIVEGFRTQWSAEQKLFFDCEVKRILSGNDFFLSFTSRSSTTLGDKPINRRYWYFIRRVIGADNITKVDKRDKNLLAKAIYIKLTDKSLKGFYFYQHENDNQKVIEKLRSGLQGSRVFVQLVENVMFNPPAARPNYCEFEYHGAKNFIQHEDSILFLVTEEREDDLEDPQAVHAPYRVWLEHILTKAAPYLPVADEYDKEVLDQINTKVNDVISKVKAAKRNILNRIPD
jgi:hypothetical protein